MWRPFRKPSRTPSADANWWRDADAVAEAPTGASIAPSIAALEARATADAAAEDADRQREMIAGLRQLADAAARDSLPIVTTQHRVIGNDACHFIGPASRVGDADSSGKLFLTSTRIVMVTGGVAAWAWHRVTRVARIDREILFTLSGADGPVHIRLNTFGEALIVQHLADRLAPRRAKGSDAGHARV